MPQLLNLGCGQRFSIDPDWTNVDFSSAHPRVIAHDLKQRFPFEDRRFDAIYHSHVLEHFTVADGRRFIVECLRVLKAGGVLRVAVPDGEQICRLYLDVLTNLKAGQAEWEARYDWMMLELLDQAVRTVSGGDMANYLRNTAVADKDFIVARVGNIGREIMNSGPGQEAHSGPVTTPTRPLWRRWGSRIKQAPRQVRQFLKNAALSEREREALALGLFRMSGEIHQWMYDSYSLRRLLESAGFVDVQRCNATESRIPDWATYCLDVGADGVEHAPSSVYMEARKKG